MDPRDQNALANRYRREAEKLGIGSPYRVKEYVDCRIAGQSKEQALAKAKSPSKNTD